jgi:hypothetical protein
MKDYSEFYEYGYRNGVLDGKTAARFIAEGKTVNHGDLLSSNDPYAIGYRHGLNS